MDQSLAFHVSLIANCLSQVLTPEIKQFFVSGNEEYSALKSVCIIIIGMEFLFLGMENVLL